jgi:HlyD family secretion protein
MSIAEATTTKLMKSEGRRTARPGRPKRKRRRWIWIALFLLLLIGGAWIWIHSRSVAAAAKAAASALQIASVSRADLERTVESSCTVVSNLDVEIKCRASGEVVTLPYDISQIVQKGSLLCQLDPTDEDLAVRLAEATVAQSTAKLEQTKLTLEQATQNLVTTRQRDEATLEAAKVKAANLQTKADRQKQLIAQQLGSPEDYETAQTDAISASSDERSAEIAIEELKQSEIQLDFKKQDVKTAEAQLQADQIELDTHKQQLAYTTVTAPLTGTVSSLDVQLGNIVASGTDAINGGTKIMTLSDLSRMFAMATVDESDIGAVQVGQPARIVVDSYPDRTFAGKVVRIAVKGVSAANVVTFEVKVEVTDEHKNLLKPQMTGTTTIIEDQRKNALQIPSAAVTHDHGKTTVTLDNGEQRTVALGLEGGEMVEVISGLAQGERIKFNAVELPSRWKSDEP